MNSYFLVGPIAQSAHDEDIRRAERSRMVKELSRNGENARGLRTRLGLALVRAGSRIMPEDERDDEFEQILNRAA
ncbi:hypothetical protein BH09CHL1_BH09CHL1_18860 [soil metagenome]